MKDVKERKKTVQARFDELIAKKTELNKQLEDIEPELFRLQGEWRLLEDLEKDPAKTVEVKDGK